MWLNRDNLFASDGAAHDRQKRLITKTFTRGRVESLRPRVERICDRLLDDARLGPVGGRFELIASLGYPLPLLVICELLGIDTVDRAAVRQWTEDLLPVIDPFPTPEQISRVFEAFAAFEAYLTALIEERRRALRSGADPPPGLLTDLVRIAESETEPMPFELLINLMFTLLVAGFENVTNLIGNAMRALSESPEQQAALRKNRALLAKLADEALRFYSTTQYNLRQAVQDISLHGATIPRGASVILLRGSANRDERRFPDPDTFDLGRPDSGQSVGFGEEPPTAPGRCWPGWRSRWRSRPCSGASRSCTSAGGSRRGTSCSGAREPWRSSTRRPDRVDRVGRVRAIALPVRTRSRPSR